MNGPAVEGPVVDGTVLNGPVGVIGAGTMGAGIAQVAGVAGRRVLIADAMPGAAERTVIAIRDRVKAQVAKGRLTIDPDALDLTAVESVAGLAGCATTTPGRTGSDSPGG